MIRATILNTLEELCGTEEVKSNPDLEIFKNDLLDSFGIIQLFLVIQEELNIEVAPTEVDREMWATPNKIINDLESRQGR